MSTELGSTYTARACLPVTPADGDLPGGKCRALWIGDAGPVTVYIRDELGEVRGPITVGRGLFPVACSQVRAATTATEVWALY
jgi:hypothetical protein